MRYKATVAAVAAAAVLMTAGAFGQAPGGMPPGPGGRPMMQGRGMGPMQGGPFAKLNLTDQQREQMQQLMQAERESNKELFGKMPELQRQLHEAIFLNNGDVNALARQINDLQAQMLQARIAHQKKVADILTPEQREQMAKMPADRGPGPMGRRGPRR